MKKLIFFLSIALLAITCTQKTTKTVTDIPTPTPTRTNPLLSEWDTPFGTPPFNKIKSEDYLDALRKGIVEHDAEIASIVNKKSTPTFKNTIIALEETGSLINRVSNIFDAVEAANTDDILKATAKKIRPEMAAHYDKIRMNKQLFNRINAVYKQRTKLNLSAEDHKLLEKTYKDFVRSGVGLDIDKQNQLKIINEKLANLTQKFGDNLLEETNSFDLYVTDKKDLGDLPENFVTAAAEEAKTRGHKSGWSFTLQRPSMYPFLQYSKNRDLRKKILNGYTHRGDNNNEFDNKKVLAEIVSLRTKKANILGYKTHADYVLEETMAENATNVFKLLDKIMKPALATAKRDRDMLAAKMKADGVKGKFDASDWRYYVREIRSEKYDFDEDQTRPYFEANAVRNGAFALAKKLFGLTFTERNDIDTWHKDQQVFEVFDNQHKHVGILYMDFFARPSKRGGAWMNEMRMQSNVDHFVSPIVTTNFNFPAPTKDSPSLLSFTQAQTVFHEFGHALHGLLSNVKYRSLSGTNVPRDFVEFPSQVIENWMSEPEILQLYAKHYKTGEVIPAAMIEKMNRANGFDEGFRSVEYLAAAYLDMFWHTLTDTKLRNVNDFEEKAMQRIGLIKEITPRYRSTYFGHITGGYSAGYYSYIWSEILAADAFAAFKATGDITDPKLAKRYRKMLSSGGTKSGMELYKLFRGQEPKIEALLKQKGFGK